MQEYIVLILCICALAGAYWLYLRAKRNFEMAYLYQRENLYSIKELLKEMHEEIQMIKEHLQTVTPMEACNKENRHPNGKRKSRRNSPRTG